MQHALESLPGVTYVEVDFDAKTATCTVKDLATFDADKAVAALDDAGYANSTVRGRDE